MSEVIAEIPVHPFRQLVMFSFSNNDEERDLNCMHGSLHVKCLGTIFDRNILQQCISPLYFELFAAVSSRTLLC